MVYKAFKIEGAPNDVPNDLRKASKEATMKFESKKNMVNILDF